MQPGEFNKGKIMDTSEESGGSEKDKDIPEEITDKKLHGKRTLGDIL